MKILSHCTVGTTFPHLRSHSSFLPSFNFTLFTFFLFFFIFISNFTYLNCPSYLPFSFYFYYPFFSFPISTTFLSFSSLPFSSSPFLYTFLPPHLPFNFSVFPSPYLVFPSSFSLPFLPLPCLILPLSPFCQVFSYWHCLYHCWQTFGSGKLCNASGGSWTLCCHCSCWAGCSRVHSSSPHLLLTHTPKPTQDGSCCTAGSANCIWNLVKVCGWSDAGSHDS